MGRVKLAHAGILPTAAAAAVWFSLATIVCTITAAAAVFCFQVDNIYGHGGAQEE